MIHKSILIAALAFLTALPALAKDDVPRGFTPLAELKEAQAKAVQDKKLVVLVVKGADDDCPYCAAALENGEAAVGSGVVRLFARAEAINKADSADFPAVLKARAKKYFTTGAAVTFVVFNPEMTEIVAEAARKELESNKETIATFKKQVQAAKKALK